MNLRGLALIAVGMVFFQIAAPLRATLGDVLANYHVGASDFVLDPIRPRLYASVPDSNSVMVVDTNTLSVLATISVGAAPSGVTVTADGSRLYVANSGSASAAISVVDLSTLNVISTLPAPLAPWEIQVGLNNRLYATTLAGNYASGNPGTMEIDGNTGSFLGYFDTDNAVLNYSRSALQISPDRQTLYLLDRGISPAALAKYDVSTATPVQLDINNPWGSIGSNGVDLVISHNGQFISAVVGSGNSNYDIRLIPTSNLSGSLGSLSTGPYPHALAFSPDDTLAYTNNYNNNIQIFSTSTGSLLGQFNLPFNAFFADFQLLTDSTGNRLFAGVTDSFSSSTPQFVVFDISTPAPEPTTGVLILGGLASLGLRRRQ